MGTAALASYGQLDFVFLDLKQHAKENKIVQKDLKRIEKLVKTILSSRKKLENELESRIPELFEFRVKGLHWIAEENEDINEILDTVYEPIEKLSASPRLRKLGHHIANALVYNRKLVKHLSEKGIVTTDSLKDASDTWDIDYKAFAIALKWMPAQIRMTVLGLTHCSIFIEFFSIAAVLIDEGEAKVTDLKLKQLNELSKEISLNYLGYVNSIIQMTSNELFQQERTEWNISSMSYFASAYGESEPDYDDYIIKEPNPEYKK